MIETREFANAEELFDALSPWAESTENDGYIFRGQSRIEWTLTPSALRSDDNSVRKLARVSGIAFNGDMVVPDLSFQIEAEFSAIRAFYRLADLKGLIVPVSNRIRKFLGMKHDDFAFLKVEEAEVWIPTDLQEVAALAQHYGIPTRLLDWSYDPYVALFFAARGALGMDGKFAIWALNKDAILMNKKMIGTPQLEFIVPHYADNPNLRAQKGLLTLWQIPVPTMQERANVFVTLKPPHVDRRPLDELIGDFEGFRSESEVLIKRLVLPSTEAEKTCRILDRAGYDYANMYPGYTGVARQLLETHKYYPSSA